MESPYYDLPPNSFRLLTLHPGEAELDILEATLSIHQLSASPPYDAISYTWGEPGDERLVQVNGRPYEVRRNFWDFLQILRAPSHNVCVWVDALCISQDDPTEKAQQVQLIGRIFRNAKRVSLWLGQSGVHTDALVNKLSIPPQDETLNDIGGSEELTNEKYEELVESRNLERKKRKDLQAGIAEIFRRPYWRRVWIIQECLLNTDVIIHCGRCSVPWEQFTSFSTNILGKTFGSRVARPDLHWSVDCEYGWQSHLYIQSYKDRAGTPVDIDLGELVDNRLRLECFDGRDQIYAFMEILKEAKLDSSARLVVDYTVSLCILWFRACHAYFSLPDQKISFNTTSGWLDRLELRDEDIEIAIRDVVDPSELFLPLRYFKTSIAGDDNKPFSIRPNHQDPDREYNILELYAADFERLATGTLKDGGRRLRPPRWWRSLYHFHAADFRGFESDLVTSLEHRRRPSIT